MTKGIPGKIEAAVAKSLKDLGNRLGKGVLQNVQNFLKILLDL
jgi:hypothetical protein